MIVVGKDIRSCVDSEEVEIGLQNIGFNVKYISKTWRCEIESHRIRPLYELKYLLQNYNWSLAIIL